MTVRRAPGGTAAERSLPEPGSAAPRLDSGLLQRVPVVLYIADAGESGRWHYVSPQIETVLGYTAEEWCADPTLWAQRLHPEDREAVLAHEREDLAGGPTVFAYDYRMLHRDGHAVWVRDDALMREGEDRVPRWHGVLSDITRQKSFEAELELRAAQQAAVARLGEHALEGASPTDLMQEAAVTTAELLGMEIGGVIELLPGREAFAFRATHGMPQISPGELVPAGKGSQAGYALDCGAPVIVSDWEREHRFHRSPILSAHGALSGLTVVIEGRRGPWGVLGLHALRAREFSPGDIDFAQAMANVLGDAVERQLTDDDIRHRALHDALTGLPNRILFMDRLQQSTERLRRRSGSQSAVLTLDFDRFKLVNDSLGHPVGDRLLAAAAPRLRQAVRSSDTVARFGGDEFGVLLEDIGSECEAIEMAERIAAVFDHPFVLESGEHFITTSIGIALASGGEAAEDLLRDADAAMHRAKERGRARYELFDEGLRGRAISRLRVENDLRRALERDEFTLDYQPLVSLQDGELIGVEALVRWEHPVRGRIAPLEFIPVAEENGLIEAIGRVVLERACRQAALWHALCPDSRPLSISVNLSAAQVADPGLSSIVSGTLATAGLDPSALSLELTESILVGDAEEVARTLEALKALGVGLVLDDFGTGYSSLAYLTRLPLDVLKVDRSFVDGLGTRPRETAITEAIIAMAQALSLRTVGEGVETERQMHELRRLGCDLAQGYLLSRPVAAEQITRMLLDGPPWAASRAALAAGEQR